MSRLDMQISFTNAVGLGIISFNGNSHCHSTNLNRELKGKTMKPIASKLNGRTWRKRMFCAASPIKTMAVPLLGLVILICTARPASAQADWQKVYVDHNNPTYVCGWGETVEIELYGDECPYNPTPTAFVTDVTVGRQYKVPLAHVTLTPAGYNGVYAGDYAAWWAGTFTVTAQDCDETFHPVTSLTVVSIDDITVQSEPV